MLLLSKQLSQIIRILLKLQRKMKRSKSKEKKFMMAVNIL